MKNVNQSAYLLFYKKEKIGILKSTSTKRSKEIPTQIFKKRPKCNLKPFYENAALPQRKQRLVSYVPKYNVLLDASVAAKKSWDRLFQDRDTLNFIQKEMTSLLNMPMTTTNQHSKNFRHSLFFKRKSSLLRKYNLPFVPKELPYILADRSQFFSHIF